MATAWVPGRPSSRGPTRKEPPIASARSRLGDALGEGHIGVASSRERAEAIGGSFRVGPRDDGRPGTQAVAILP